MKKFWKILIIVLLVLLVLAGGYVAYVFLDYHRIPDNQTLDVYEQEPPADDCPLYAMDNVLMMPHMGGPTVDLRSHITHDLLLESAAYLDHNEPLRHEITRARAEHMSSH